MATLKPVIVPAKVLKGGKHKVRIALSHNSKTRYIVTDIVIDSSKEFKDGQIVKRDDAASKNTKLRKLLQEYQKNADEINNIECLACSEIPDPTIQQSWLTVDEVKAIRDIDSTQKWIIKCRDVFMLSYYLGGINICDLVKINFNLPNDVLRYVRTKTDRKTKINKFVEFEIPEEAKQIINKYKGIDGKLCLQKNQEKNLMRSFFRRTFPLLGKLAGIEHLIYYSARKSQPTHLLTWRQHERY